jgi:shikimate kinase
MERGGIVRNEIVLIGPVGVGKTTVSKLLAERLSIPKVSMDDILFDYFRDVGFIEEHWKSIAEKLGRPAAYRYLKVFGSYGVKRILEDHKNCVFDFGGGGVMGEFPDEFAAMKSALADFENVVFLIPSPDKKESLEFLYDRLKINPPGWTLLEHFVFHPTHDELAKHVIYVKGKTPEQICEEILRIPTVRGRLL